MRERFFTPRLRVKSYEELDAWLLDRTVAFAKAHRHPELRDRTVWEAFEAERPSLVPYRGRFDGFHALPVSVSKICLVRCDNNRYSVMASAVGRPTENLVHQLAPASRPQSFFESTSCSIVLSSDRSATSRFSFAFSSSIWRSFLTSDGIIPPYRLRQL
ncbi:hypothetical protein GCM10011390_21710 [Aureimonas endophytica]|uniref:Transposase for insertion sequence element IS21-like C-terminal domain-containing protein n=1 Tax=Aureimonas endophytica TaxID=2027858 RepID=A0A916ZKM8_9HYPH|nr:hypothetical protein GCM10011390_21710 [Aureimonas endophytica]